MIIWLIIILALIFLFLTIKFEKLGRSTKMFSTIFIIILLVVFYFSVSIALSGKTIDYKSPKGIMNAAVIYGSWVADTSKDVFSVGSKSISTVGNVIKDNFGKKK